MKPFSLHQILVNTLRAEPDLHLGHDHFGQGFALTLSPNAIAGGRNGWFYFTSFFKPGGRNGWFCFTSFFNPAVGMAGFASPASSSPVVEMAGFANRKYRPTVSRSIPSSRAIRRRDQPRSSKL